MSTAEHRVSRASAKATANRLDLKRTIGVYLAPAMLICTIRTEMSGARIAPAELKRPQRAVRQHLRRAVTAGCSRWISGRRTRELPVQPGGSPLEVGARSFIGFSQREGDEQGSRPRLEFDALPFPRERSGGPGSGRPNGRSQLAWR